MKLYDTIRISSNGIATYGDKYVTIGSDNQYQYNDIIEIQNSKYLVLFEKE